MSPPGPSVDTPAFADHSRRVMAKPHKVEEPAAPYLTAKKPAPQASAPAQPSVRYARPEDVRKVADKIFAERKELFRKLAQ